MSRVTTDMRIASYRAYEEKVSIQRRKAASLKLMDETCYFCGHHLSMEGPTIFDIRCSHCRRAHRERLTDAA